jgi:hypothetical protein
LVGAKETDVVCTMLVEILVSAIVGLGRSASVSLGFSQSFQRNGDLEIFQMGAKEFHPYVSRMLEVTAS